MHLNKYAGFREWLDKARKSDLGALIDPEAYRMLVAQGLDGVKGKAEEISRSAGEKFGQAASDKAKQSAGDVTRAYADEAKKHVPDLVEAGSEAVQKQVPKFMMTLRNEADKHMPEMVNNATTAAINSATTGDNKKKLDELGRSVGDSAMSGALNNKQLQQWMFRAGGGLAGALLLSSFMKNKSLAWLLGLVGGGLAGNYVHSNWKGDWGKTWDSMKSRWGSK